MNKKLMLGLTALVAVIGTSIMSAPAANAQGFFVNNNNYYDNMRAREIRHERIEHRRFERRLLAERRGDFCHPYRRFGW